MWRTPKTHVNAGFTGSAVGTPQNGYPGSPNYPFTQAAYSDLYEVLYSEDNAKERSDKRCEHYARHTRVHRAPIAYAQSSYSTPSAGPWLSWTCDVPSANWGWMSSGSYSYPYGTSDSPVVGGPSVYSDSSDPAARRCGGDLNYDVYSDRCLQAILPGIRPRLSAVNSVIELKDFKSLAKDIRRLYKTYTRLDRILRDKCARYRAERLGKMLSLRKIVGGSSKAYLSWMFGIAPFVSDLMSVRTSMKRFRYEVRKLLENEGRDQVRHFATPITEYQDTDDHYDSGAPLPSNVKGSLRYWRHVRYQKAVFRATVAYSYELSNWSPEEATLRGFLDSLGVNLNPAILWNAIPWSFVVDWVVDVGRWLDQFKVRNLEPRTRITRYCISSEIVRTCQLTYQVMPDASFGFGCGEVPVCTQSEETYYRSPWRMGMLRSISTSGLSSQEFILGSALIASR